MQLSKFINIVQNISITSLERITRLYYELESIRALNIEGDLVECGVYMGGNILGMMEYCHAFKMNKKIWLYDTFNGMTEPKDIDKDLNNISAKDQFNKIKCYAGLEQVKMNLSISNFTNIKYVIGDVCETLKHINNIPEKISLLRLDTDWYDSTKCELEILFPRLENNGSLIIDDYGHWNGCRIATDDFFKNTNYNLIPIDYTGVYLRK
jgi:O-methyltransferase